MSTEKAEIQSLFRIWPAHGGAAFLEVLADSEGMVRIQTTTKESADYFGKVEVSFEKDVANKIAEALRALT